MLTVPEVDCICTNIYFVCAEQSETPFPWQEPVLRECKASLVEKYATAGRLGEEVKTIQTQLESKSGQVRPDTLLALLEAANQEAEEESETLMETFLQDGGLV